MELPVNHGACKNSNPQTFLQHRVCTEATLEPYKIEKTTQTSNFKVNVLKTVYGNILFHPLVLPKMINDDLEDNIYSCVMCDFKTYSILQLYFHETTHKHEYESKQIKIEQNMYDLEPQHTSRNTKDLTKHKLTRDPINTKSTKSYECDHCDYASKSRQCFAQHWRRMHQQHPSARRQKIRKYEPVLNTCNSCSFTSQTVMELKQHSKETHNKELRWKCEHCSKELKTKSILKNHILNKHANEDEIHWFECAHCPFKTKHKKVLETHILAIHTENSKISKWYECDQCNYVSKFSGQLLNHKNSTHNKNLYRCDQCDFGSKHEVALKRHKIYRHTPPEDIQWLDCEQCEYRTQYKHHFKKHKEVKHTSSDQMQWYECAQCGFKTVHKEALIRHMKYKHTSANDLKWHQCKNCDYKGKILADLNKHISSQHSNSWYECADCKYKSRVKGALVQHIRLRHRPHKKRFSCDLCDYKTHKKQYLTKHVLIHQEKDENVNCIECAHCAYKTKRKTVLAMHLKRCHLPPRTRPKKPKIKENLNGLL